MMPSSCFEAIETQASLGGVAPYNDPERTQSPLPCLPMSQSSLEAHEGCLSKHGSL